MSGRQRPATGHSSIGEKLYVEAGPQQTAASAPKIGWGTSQGVRREVPTPEVFAPGRAPFFVALFFALFGALPFWKGPISDH